MSVLWCQLKEWQHYAIKVEVLKHAENCGNRLKDGAYFCECAHALGVMQSTDCKRRTRLKLMKSTTLPNAGLK